MLYRFSLLFFGVVVTSLGLEDSTTFDLGDSFAAMTGPTDLASDLGDNDLFAETSPDNNSLFSPIGEDDSNQNLLFAADSCSSATDELGFKETTDGVLKPRNDNSPATCSSSNSPTKLKLPDIPTTLDGLKNSLSSFTSWEQKTEDPVVKKFLNDGVELMDRLRCSDRTPYHLCCNCDPRWGWAVCVDCVPMSLLSACYAPYMEVCCILYGDLIPIIEPGDNPIEDDWYYSMVYSDVVNRTGGPQGGTLAEHCIETAQMPR